MFITMPLDFRPRRLGHHDDAALFRRHIFLQAYGNRSIVLETVASVPGMVGGMLVHLRCLRWMVADEGWIRTLLEEAEN
jgi:ubiquinol oxidase